MFSSFVEFFATEKKLLQTKNQRRSSTLQGPLPTILFTTNCIDFEPLSPLITTDPINVPFTYHDYGKSYSSSLDSLSTSRTNSLASSSSSSSYGSPTSSMPDNDDDGPLPLLFDAPSPSISTSSMNQSSCGDINRVDHSGHHHPEPKIITKMALFENIRHSLCLFVSPSFTSMSWTTATTPTPITTTTITSVCDNVIYEVDEDHTVTTNPPIQDHHSHYPHRLPQPSPIYTRALRENPDHLRMIVSEVNMMRVNKLTSPLRPRAILLERSDPFIPSTPSPLRYTV